MVEDVMDTPVIKHVQENKKFGGWSISSVLFDYILDTLAHGSTIVECGSGWASGELSRYYTVYSIEHDKRWLDKYDTHYIYAPLKGRWYDAITLQKALPDSYDFILVDGPPWQVGRAGFLQNISLFKNDVPIVVDDVHIEPVYDMMVSVAQKLGRSWQVHASEKHMQFGVI